MRESLPVGRIIMLVTASLGSLITLILTVVFALRYSQVYGFFEVPFVSWYVFAILAILILDGVTAYLWWKEAREKERTISSLKAQLEKAKERISHFKRQLQDLWNEAREKEQMISQLQKQLQGQRIPLIIYNLEPLTKAEAQPEYLPIVERLFIAESGIKGIELTSLGGGYSGSSTFKVYIKDQDNRRKGPYILKLGKKQEIQGERDKYENYVEGFIANHPNIYNCELETPGEYAGVAYDFVGMGGKIQNFQEFYKTKDDITQITDVIQALYESMKKGKEEQKVWHGDKTEQLYNLYEEYYLPDDKRRDISNNIFKVALDYLRIDPDNPILNDLPADFPDVLLSIHWGNPVHFITDWDNKVLRTTFWKCTVHGDLHSRNIIIEKREKKEEGKQFIPWLIDFSHTGNGLSATRTEEAMKQYSQIEEGRGHILRDFCRLEADIKFCLTELHSEDDLIQALLFEKELMNYFPRLDPDRQSHPQVLNDDRFKKTWEYVQKIRHLAEEYLHDPSDYLSLLHATLPVVYYSSELFDKDKHREKWQKMYALLSAGMLCGQLTS